MSGYKTHRFSQEPDDYDGPWPKESVMTKPTAEQVMQLANEYAHCYSFVGDDTMPIKHRELRAAIEALAAPAAPQQVEPVAWRDHVEQRLHNWRQRTMNRSGDRLALDDMMSKESIDDLIDYVCDEWSDPVAPQQAEPVAQIGWADEFGNLFPMGAWKPAQRTHHDSHKAAWRPVFLHPPAAEVQTVPEVIRNADGNYVIKGSPPAGPLLDELLAQCELKAEVQRLRDALENVRLLAARHRTEEWANHMLRFCADVGVKGSPLREGGK